MYIAVIRSPALMRCTILLLERLGVAVGAGAGVEKTVGVGMGWPVPGAAIVVQLALAAQRRASAVIVARATIWVSAVGVASLTRLAVKSPTKLTTRKIRKAINTATTAAKPIPNHFQFFFRKEPTGNFLLT